MNIQPNDVNKVQDYKDESEKVFNYLATIPLESLSSKYPLIEILIPWLRKEPFNLSEINVEKEQARKLSKLAPKVVFKLVANYLERLIAETNYVINNMHIWANSSLILLILSLGLIKLYIINENTLGAKILQIAPAGFLLLLIVVFVLYVFQYNQCLKIRNILHKYKLLVETAEIVKE